METARGVNKHIVQSHCGEYLLLKDIQNLQNDRPIDLTNSRATFHHVKEVKPTTSTFVPNNLADNQVEVLKAAKSLFSKKTRTLYHWMYPNTPKFQLKSAVSLAWDTMGLQEKQFYISQVLGKFGYLQSSLMVNPQLVCMTLPHPQLSVGQPDLSNLETSNAVSNLLQEDSNWNPVQQHAVVKRRGRPRGSKRVEKTYKPRRHHKNPKYHEEEDFNDDPELRKELEQFQWALHLVEK